MIELLLVLALVLGLVVVTIVGWTSLLMAGVVATGLGLVFGVSTGLWYHILLAQALVAANANAPGWWLRPTSFHERLDEAARQRLMPWFYAGGAGFVVTVIGLVLLAVGIAAGYLRQS